jgi:hypothetical protein
MWINKQFFELVLADNRKQQQELQDERTSLAVAQHAVGLHREQKAKDDITIDWLRHRVNALEKEKGSLLASKGIPISVPEIVPGRPGTMSAPPSSFDSMPSFEDIGDEEAKRLGVDHDADGNIVFGMPVSSR